MDTNQLQSKYTIFYYKTQLLIDEQPAVVPLQNPNLLNPRGRPGEIQYKSFIELSKTAKKRKVDNNLIYEDLKRILYERYSL